MFKFTLFDTEAGQLGRGRHEVFIDQSPTLLAIIASDFRMKILNAAWEKALGLKRDQLVDRSLREFVDLSEHPAVTRLLNPRSTAIKFEPLEFSLRCQDGTYRCFEWQRRPVPTDEAMFVVGNDITKRKQREVSSNIQLYAQLRGGRAASSAND
jgi:PAS domain S-box-containing protein